MAKRLVRACLAVALFGNGNALPHPIDAVDNELVELEERLLMFAHGAKLHIDSDYDLHRVAANTSLMAIDEHRAYGKLSAATMRLLVSEVGATMGVANAASHGLMVTIDQLDKIAGEGGTTNKELEEGGEQGEDGEIANKAQEGDMFPGGAMDADVHAMWKAGTGKPWTNAVVKYCFAPDTADAVKDIVKKSAVQFKNILPCMELKDVGYKSGTVCNESPAIYITSKPQGCWSYVGEIRSWKSQGFNLQSPGCDTLGISMHEFLHAMGQSHEQSRSDRDEYVTVHFGKIKKGKENNFQARSGTDIERQYDMLSLMHYGPKGFSTDGSPTITVKDKAYERYCDKAAGKCSGFKIGNRLGLTQDDAEQLAAQYGCTANRNSGETICTDSKTADGGEWKTSSGKTCATTTYKWDKADGFGKSYSKYAKYGCCRFGGGFKMQKWVNKIAPPNPPPSPPGNPLPPASPPPAAPPPPDCSALKDKYSSRTCKGWKNKYCKTNSWVRSKCPFTCAGCVAPVPPPPPPPPPPAPVDCSTVKDKYSSRTCKGWKNKYCKTNSWVRSKCPFTCAGCDKQDISPSFFQALQPMDLHGTGYDDHGHHYHGWGYGHGGHGHGDGGHGDGGHGHGDGGHGHGGDGHGGDGHGEDISPSLPHEAYMNEEEDVPDEAYMNEEEDVPEPPAEAFAEEPPAEAFAEEPPDEAFTQ